MCRSGLDIHPGYLSARVTCARALVELDRLDEARTEFQTVLASAPDNLAALRGLAEVHHRLGAVDDALAMFRRALRLAPNDPDLDRTVNDLLRKAAQAKPAEPDGLLSLDDLARELDRHVLPAQRPSSGRRLPEALTDWPSEAGPVAATAPRFAAAAPSNAPVASDVARTLEAARARDLATLAALEGWLAAIHGARAERRA